jgi:hypothetical protein
MEDAVVGEVAIRRDRAASGDLEVDPATRREVPCRAVGTGRSEPPRSSDGRVSLPDVGEPHQRRVVAGITAGV